MNRYNFIGIIVILIWATSAPLLRQIILFSQGEFLTVIFFYNLLAAVLLLGTALVKGEIKSFSSMDKPLSLLPMIALNGFYDVFVALAITFAATVQYAIVANYLWPILLVLFFAIKQGALPGRILIGSILGFSAVALLFFPESSEGILHNSLGIGFGILAALCWSFYSFKLGKEHRSIPIFIQGAAQLLSGITVLLIGVFLGKIHFGPLMNLPALMTLLIYGAVNMGLAYVLWIHLVIGHGAFEKFAPAIYVLPILSIAVTSLWFRESLNKKVFIALPLILLGIVLANWKQREIN